MVLHYEYTYSVLDATENILTDLLHWKHIYETKETIYNFLKKLFSLQ